MHKIYIFIDHIVNNIRLTQNLTCILKMYKKYNSKVRFSKYVIMYILLIGCSLRLQLILYPNFALKKMSCFFLFPKRVFKDIFPMFYSLKVLAILCFGLSNSLFIGLKQNHFLTHYKIPNNRMI